MEKKYNILVTGCGGDIGQSIGKILSTHSMFDKVIGCSLDTDNAAKFIFNEIHVLPRCTEPGYMNELQSVIKKESIDIVVPIAEADLRMYSHSDTESNLPAKPLVMANKKSRDIGFDKLATAEFLKRNLLPYPETSLAKDSSLEKFPLIIKGRKSAGSKQLLVINDAEELAFYSKKFPGYIIQEMIGNENAEYTCGLFRSANSEIRHIIFKRKLTAGFSIFGVYEENEAISKLLITLAELLDLRGSINVQLRLSEKGPYIFEINPRFSSTVLFRHLMGFEDVIWSIQDLLGLPVSPYKRKTELTKFYKGFSEYVE